MAIHASAVQNCATRGFFAAGQLGAVIGVLLFLPQLGHAGSASGIGWPHDEHFSATFIS